MAGLSTRRVSRERAAFRRLIGLFNGIVTHGLLPRSPLLGLIAAAVAVSDGDQTRDARSAVLSESFEELEQHYDKLRLSSRGVQGWDAFSRCGPTLAQ